MLKGRLKEWSKNNRGICFEDTLNQIASWERIHEERFLTDDEILQKTNLGMEFEELAKNEEIAWRQRFRV